MLTFMYKCMKIMPIYVSYYAQGSNPKKIEPRRLRLEHAKNYENEYFQQDDYDINNQQPFFVH